jgi:hypothetical protein
MSLSLLLDENLSEKLLPLLFDRFPDSRHVRLIGLGGADDLAIWSRGFAWLAAMPRHNEIKEPLARKILASLGAS